MSVIKDGVVCWDPDCWLSSSWAFKNMPTSCSCIRGPWKPQDVLIQLAACRLSWLLFQKDLSLIILCQSLQYSTLLTSGMVLLCIDECGPHR